MHDRPTFGSLFAGIGGIDLGLERAGWECRFQVEWDEFCQRVLAKHWPDVPRYGDITTVDWSGVERVDLLAGGFPCQPVSSAGRQKAQGDARWLWPEFDRAIRELRPRYVLVENVTNLLAINDGSAFGDVLGDLAASGYDAEWDCIPAAAVGAPHDRDRVWLVAYVDGHGLDVASGRQGGPEGAAFSPTRALGEHGGDRGGRSVRRAGAALADANGLDVEGAELQPSFDGGARARGGGSMAHTNGEGPQGHRGLRVHGDGASERLAGARRRAEQSVWKSDAGIRRVAHGVPARVDRLRSLGNAVVPQVVEVIGRQLLASLERVA